MNQKEYAKRTGLSQPTVSNFIRQGILKESVKKIGKRYQINAKLADQERKRKLDPIAGGDRTKKKKKPTPEKKQATAEQAKTAGIDFNEARRLNEQYKAALKKLDYEERTGKLIPAQEIKRAWIQHISSAKVKILGVPAKLTPIIRDLVADIDSSSAIISAIENEINDLLNELMKSRI
jgi:uncharacterized protein YecT (DUF1311 family)